jgi:hypothetical protein
MEDLKIFLKKFTLNPINKNMMLLDYGMSIDLSMIWLLSVSKAMEDMCGPAKIMMEMSNRILLLKGMDLLV